jgi:hypothetical protein
MPPNVSDNSIGVLKNFNARISQNSKPQSRQINVSRSIFLSHLRLEVLTSVNFYDDHFRWAAEVYNVISDCLLPVELQTL